MTPVRSSGEGPAAAEGSGSAISGIPLAQYAVVTAALAEGHPLKAVLAAEELDAARWAKADSGWTERLDEDGALLATFQKALAAAQDRLGRTVEPIDTDLRAWVAFLAAFGHEREGWLSQHGMNLDDVARLRRRWEARMSEEPALRKEADMLQRNGAGELPALRVVKARLTRSGTGLSTAARASVPPPASRSPSADTPQTSTPAPRAPALRPKPASSAEPSTIDGVKASVPLPFGSVPSPEFLNALHRPAAHPGDGSDGETVDVFMSGARATFEMADGSTVILSPAESLQFTGNPLPFREGPLNGPAPVDGPNHRAEPLASPPPAARAERAPEFPKLYPDEPLVETVTGIRAPEGMKVLPFGVPESVAPPNVVPPAPSKPRIDLKLPKMFDDEDSVDGVETTVYAPKGKIARPVEDAKRGGMQLSKTQRGAERPAPSKSPASAAGTPKVELPVMYDEPSVETGTAVFPQHTKSEKPPRGSSAPGPALTLEQHAALSLEIVLDPAHADEALARYHLSPADKARFDQLFRAQIDADASMRVRWNRAFESHRGRFVVRKRP